MKFDRTKYTAHFENGIIVAQWVSIEASIDSSMGESPIDALNKSEELAQQWYKSKNLPFQDNSIPIVPPPTIQIKPEDKEIGVTPDTLLSCSDLAILEAYRLIVKGKPELERAYILRHDQLSIK